MDKRNAIFQLAYDGPALQTHEMDVKDLAPALLAVGELLEEANRLLNGERVKIAVNIKATKEGSVEVVLSVIQDLVKQAVLLFSGTEVSAFINAHELLSLLGLGGTGGGVVGILLWVKNRPIKSVTTLDMDDLKIELADGEAKVVKSQEIKLFSLLTIRRNLETLIKGPLSRDGIDRVVFIKDNEKQEISKDQIKYFDAPDITEELIDEKEIETCLQIVNVSFQADGKWRFSDGNASFFADILDKAFLSRVQKNEASFAKDDILKVLLVRRQFLSSGGIKTDYVIKSVLEHRSAAIQIKLPFSGK